MRSLFSGLSDSSRLLYQWAPIIRNSILRRGRSNWLVALSAEPKLRVLGVPLALGGAIFLGIVALWDLTFSLGVADGLDACSDIEPLAACEWS